MNIIEVNNKKLAKEFLDVPRLLYKNDKNWICPLDNIINSIYNQTLSRKVLENCRMGYAKTGLHL